MQHAEILPVEKRDGFAFVGTITMFVLDDFARGAFDNPSIGIHEPIHQVPALSGDGFYNGAIPGYVSRITAESPELVIENATLPFGQPPGIRPATTVNGTQSVSLPGWT